MLLDEGADVNTQGGAHSNALQAAWVEGHEKIVDVLVNREAKVSAQGGYYGNALQAACLEGHVEIVGRLLQWGLMSILMADSTAMLSKLPVLTAMRRS
jgi:ankyrin repeat protein